MSGLTGGKRGQGRWTSFERPLPAVYEGGSMVVIVLCFVDRVDERVDERVSE